MNLISISKLGKKSDDKTLFCDLNFGLNEGEKIAVIGVNGSGKSTLLKMILGFEEPDEGAIFKNRNLKISSLDQNPFYEPSDTILEHIYKGKSHALTLVKDYLCLCEKMKEGSTETLENELHQLMENMDKYDSWQYENQIKSILQELGIFGLGRKMSELSGGMLKKVELVQTLIDDSNLLILDEPTNHLDAQTIQWLETFLLKTNKAILLVTHDRYFLDRVVDKILEISMPKSILFSGNYDYYLEKKVEMDEAAAKIEEKKESFLRVELEWLRRQPKARGTKQKARTEKILSIANREKITIQEDFKFQVDPKKAGKKILEMSNISKSYNDRVVIKKFNYTFKHYERLGIVGPNGSGKSTFLNIITGKVLPDSGSVNRGLNTSFGYFDQNNVELDESMRVLEFVQKKVGDFVAISDGKKMSAGFLLEKFQFSSKAQSGLIQKLSGGEKRRLYLVQILMSSPNFLILDEPTNDFDIKTLSILEEFLLDFPGCVVTVSHDRYFMDRVADHLLVFDGSGDIRGYSGTYTEYLDFQKSSTKEKSAIDAKVKPIAQVSSNQKTNPLKFKKDLENLEKEIEGLEKEKNKIQEDLIQFHSDFNKVQELSHLLNSTEELLNSKYKKWEDFNSV